MEDLFPKNIHFISSILPDSPRPLPLHRRHGVSYRRLAEGLGEEMVRF